MNRLVVILPVYNGGHYLKQSVESILDQSAHDFDFFILDDCSTDGSWEYLSGLKDDRIRLFRNDVNRGLFYNLNFLIKSSDADLIKLWSQDDIMYPQCIERILAFHKKYPQIGFSYTAIHTIDEDGIIQEKTFIDETPELISPELHARIAFYTGSIAGNIANVTLNRKALNEVGLFREDMKISGDFDMWVRLAKDNPVGFIKEALIQLRDHKKQLSRQEIYYIFHLTEDLQVYRYLLSYVSKAEQKAGKLMLRNFKLMFYYTLMMKTLVKGKLGVTIKFWKALAGFDSMLLLTASFIRNKCFKSVRKDLLFKDNILLFK
ncbi:MAG TPA: glycosyltransferase [Niastella sp.]